MREINLGEEELKKLEEIEKKITDIRKLKRLQCIKLKNNGKGHREIGEFLNRGIETISKWIKIYTEEGIDVLLKKKHKGKISKLEKAQLEQLKKRDKETPFDTAKEAKAYIKKEFGIDFHLHWVQKLLKKNRSVIQKNKINTREKSI